MTNEEFESLGLKDLDLILLFDGAEDGRTGLYMGGYVPYGSFFLFAPADAHSSQADANVVLVVNVQSIMKL